MKKLCYTAFVAFWSSIATLLALHSLAGDQQAQPANQATETTPSYTLEEVAQHAARDDCWMAIEGGVYDLTAYIDQHPTSPSVITSWCGSEATQGMRTKGYGNDHSESAWQLLNRYRIGDLKQASP